MKQSVKRWLGRCIFGSRLNAVLLANAAVVVAFHRVEETGVDGLTVSRSTFEDYCEYFARQGIEADPLALADALWTRFTLGEL